MITYKVEPNNNVTTATFTDRDAQILELGATLNMMSIINKHGAVYVTTKSAVDLIYKLLKQHHDDILCLVGEKEL